MGQATMTGTPGPRVAVAITDHGWGHASRMTPVVAELRRRGWPVLVLAGPDIAESFRRAAPGCEVLTARMDRGLRVEPGGAAVDLAATEAILRESLAAPDVGLVEALRPWRPDVVLADATPWAADLAHAAGARAVLCSNFSWEEQYASSLGETAEVEALRERVRRFDGAIVLPLGTGVGAVRVRRPVPLISRMPQQPAETLARLGLDPGRPLVAWALGRTPPSAQPLDLFRALARLCLDAGAQLVAAEPLRTACPDAAFAGAPDHLYWPDLLAASRVVVSKAGYSTLAEALRGSARLLVIRGHRTAEESAMAEAVLREDYGLAVDAGAGEAEFVRAAGELLQAPPREPITERGEQAVADYLAAVARRGPAPRRR
jgi:hypothetical protein